MKKNNFCPICETLYITQNCNFCNHEFIDKKIEKNYYEKKNNRNPDDESNYYKNEERINDLKKIIKNSDKVLDIGCSDGLFLKLIKEKYPNIDCFGIEPSKDKIKLKLKQIKIKNDFEYFKKYKFKFDLITSFHVLEHIKNVKKFIKECINLLSENGFFILEVPNKSGNIFNIYDNNAEHYHKFSISSLCLLLEKNNLEIIKLETLKIESPIYNNCMRVLVRKNNIYNLRKKYKNEISSLLKENYIFYGIGLDFEKMIHPFIKNYKNVILMDGYVSLFKNLKKVVRYDYNYKNYSILITSLSNENDIYKQLIKSNHPKNKIVLFSDFLNSLN